MSISVVPLERRCTAAGDTGPTAHCAVAEVDVQDNFAGPGCFSLVWTRQPWVATLRQPWASAWCLVSSAIPGPLPKHPIGLQLPFARGQGCAPSLLGMAMVALFTRTWRLRETLLVTEQEPSYLVFRYLHLQGH